MSCIRALSCCVYAYRYRLALLAFLSPVASIPALLNPWVMQLLIDKAYPARDLRLFAWLCAAMLLLRIVPNTLTTLSGYLSMYTQNLVEYRLSLRVLDAIQRLPQSYREQHDSGMFLERATRDVGSVAGSLTRLMPQIVTIAFTFLAVIPLMLRLNVGVTLLVLAIVPLNYAVTACLSHRLRALLEASRAMDEKITTFTSETIEGATIARLFSLKRRRRHRFKQLLRDRLRITLATWRTTTFWGQLGDAIGTIWGMLLLCGGWYLVFIDRLQLGEAVALGMYVNMLSRPFQDVGRLYQSLMRDSVAARRVLEVLNVRYSMTENNAQRALMQPPHRLELCQVVFGYKDGRLCLRDLNLQVERGQTIAVVGPSGAGKSTLIRILSGLDDRYQGRFLVDGRDFRDISRDSYLRHVSLVPQNSFFFSDSIRDNLYPSNGSVSLQELQRYVSILGLRDLVDSAPEGYDTRLGSEGTRLSAGQYQKLATLRALLKTASILLLDEVTSAMDIESERRLLKGLMMLRSSDCLMVLVTHHLALTTESWIDKIVVMVDGQLVEQGSYAQLRENHGFYHHWLTLSRSAALDHAILADQLARQGA